MDVQGRAEPCGWQAASGFFFFFFGFFIYLIMACLPKQD